jgi:hypothetical protein
MIRRDDTPSDGPPRWLLISQLEHARVSADLATHWGNPPMAAIEPRETILATIRRHDDGWQSWESRPAVNGSGAPVSFTEMPTAEGNAIWQRSIESLADLGPLAQYLVASHFVQRRRKSTQTAAEWASFVTEFDRRRTAWLADWQQQDVRANTVERAALALRQLQFFDALSLWFCCQPLGKAETRETPAGVPLTLTPVAADEVRISPWPMTRPSVEILATARSVPRRSYASAEELAAVESKTEVLRWRLSPGNG